MSTPAQARPRCKLKVRGCGYVGETPEVTAARCRKEAIYWHNRKALAGSPIFVSLDREADGRCFLYLRGPKLCKKGGKPRALRPVDAALYAALPLPTLQTYVTEHGYHVARIEVDPAIYAAIPLYPEE